jgi:hypothetical protein
MKEFRYLLDLFRGHIRYMDFRHRKAGSYHLVYVIPCIWKDDPEVVYQLMQFSAFDQQRFRGVETSALTHLLFCRL